LWVAADQRFLRSTARLKQVFPDTVAANIKIAVDIAFAPPKAQEVWIWEVWGG